MMERGGGRSLVLLGVVATLLLLSSWAVSGIRDENEGDFRRSAGRLERQRSHGGVISVEREAAHVREELKQREWLHDAHLRSKHGEWREFKPRESVEVVDEKKPAEGIWEKARSFLSGLRTSIGHGISIPASLFRGKKHWAGPGKAEKAFGRKGYIPVPKKRIVGRRDGFDQSRWDLIRIPERLPGAAGAADLTPEERWVPLKEETPVNPVTSLRGRITLAVLTVVEEYNAGTVNSNVGCDCVDAVEIQVRTFLKRVKSALRERICNGDLASLEEQTFCNLLNNHPTLATFQSLSMMTNKQINPVIVSWHQTYTTAACRVVNSHNILRNLEEIEGMALQFNMLLPEVIDSEDSHLEHNRDHRMFHRVGREHGDHERNWWQRAFGMWRKQKQMKHHGFEHAYESSVGKPHDSEEMHKHGDHERHSGQQILSKDMKPHHFEERHGHGDHENHEKHGLQRAFGMWSKPKQMKHQGFEHAHDNSARDECFYKSVKYLSRGIRQHLATTCETTTSPNAIAACKFAKEHHFLVNVWLAVKTPLLSEAAKSCMSTFEDRHAPDLRRFVTLKRKNPVDGADAFNEAVETKDRRLNTIPAWIPPGCARNHANRGLSKSLHLRGHVIDISHGDSGLQGRVRTHLVVVGGHPIHLHEFQDALEIVEALVQGSSGDMLTDLQDRVAEFVRDSALEKDASSGEHRAGFKTEMTVLGPHHHTNFRTSPNSITAGGPHFRISAMPRVVREANTEMSVIEPAVGEIDAHAHIKLQDIPEEAAEKRADM